jgi:hypothetical protein
VGGIVRLNSGDLEDWLAHQRDRSIRVPAHAPDTTIPPSAGGDDISLRLIA